MTSTFCQVFCTDLQKVDEVSTHRSWLQHYTLKILQHSVEHGHRLRDVFILNTNIKQCDFSVNLGSYVVRRPRTTKSLINHQAL